MRQRVSTRSLGILAVCLATASAVISWRTTARYLTAAKKFEREITILDSVQTDLQHNMLGLAALVQKTGDNPPGWHGITPTDPRVAQWCEDIDSSIPLLETFETVRADDFLLWYHTQMKKHHLPETARNPVLVARNDSAKEMTGGN